MIMWPRVYRNNKCSKFDWHRFSSYWDIASQSQKSGGAHLFGNIRYMDLSNCPYICNNSAVWRCIWNQISSPAVCLAHARCATIWMRMYHVLLRPPVIWGWPQMPKLKKTTLISVVYSDDTERFISYRWYNQEVKAWWFYPHWLLR